MKVYLNILMCLTFYLTSMTAQQQSTNDPLWVEQKDQKLYFVHVVEKGNTLYSLARKFNMTIEEFSSKAQGMTKDVLQIGDTLWIPLENQSLRGVPSTHSKSIYYRVQAKENLFRIARVYLGVKEEQIMVLNRMENTQINIDQDLLLGYLDFTSTPTIQKDSKESTDNYPNTKIADRASELPPNSNQKSDESSSGKIINSSESSPSVVKTFQERSGVAIWFDDTDAQSGLFVMHETAPVNSTIYITNPMFNKTIQAKVVGNIPPNTYPKEVIVVISQAVAKSLGALDKRFFAKIKYEVHTLQ